MTLRSLARIACHASLLLLLCCLVFPDLTLLPLSWVLVTLLFLPIQNGLGGGFKYVSQILGIPFFKSESDPLLVRIAWTGSRDLLQMSGILWR